MHLGQKPAGRGRSRTRPTAPRSPPGARDTPASPRSGAPPGAFTQGSRGAGALAAPTAKEESHRSGCLPVTDTAALSSSQHLTRPCPFPPPLTPLWAQARSGPTKPHHAPHPVRCPSSTPEVPVSRTAPALLGEAGSTLLSCYSPSSHASLPYGENTQASKQARAHTHTHTL